MELYSSNKDYKLYHGNMLDMLEVIEPNTIDSIITDPPYGLTSIIKRFGKEDSAECQYGKDGSFQRLSRGFMGKEWDGSGIEYNVDAWRNNANLMEMVKEELEKTDCEECEICEDYKSRIEKAVEYIKDNAKYQKATINNNKYYSEYLINQVLDILNGRSDE